MQIVRPQYCLSSSSDLFYNIRPHTFYVGIHIFRPLWQSIRPPLQFIRPQLQLIRPQLHLAKPSLHFFIRSPPQCIRLGHFISMITYPVPLVDQHTLKTDENSLISPDQLYWTLLYLYQGLVHVLDDLCWNVWLKFEVVVDLHRRLHVGRLKILGELVFHLVN